MTALFLDPQYMKDNSIIDNNVDDKLLLCTFLEVQELYIKPLLGSVLYNKISTDINSGTLTGNYKTLIDTYVRPTIKYYSLYELSVTLNYRFSNLALSQLNIENAVPSTREDISFIRSILKNKAEVFAERSSKYLQANTTLFPEYEDYTNSDDIVSEKSSNYRTGLYTGYTRNWGPKWDY